MTSKNVLANRETTPREMSSALELLQQQRSHVLFVLSNSEPEKESSFLKWYQGAYRQAVLDSHAVLSAQHYEQHEIDISEGRLARIPFHYLGLYELSLDGAQEADSLINKISRLHQEQPAARAPATWLYYPVSEKVGRPPISKPSMLTLAFANGVPGQESEFREWYATRHIRHALNVPALVSGQCFERTQFQRPGALEASFATIAMYEQEGTPEEMLHSFADLIPKGTFRFPTMDRAPSRFSEWVYRPI